MGRGSRRDAGHFFKEGEECLAIELGEQIAREGPTCFLPERFGTSGVLVAVEICLAGSRREVVEDSLQHLGGKKIVNDDMREGGGCLVSGRQRLSCIAALGDIEGEIILA